jgi:hypothetical protein
MSTEVNMKESKGAKLFFKSYNGENLTGVEVPFPGKFELLRQSGRFMDGLMILAGLPRDEDLPQILAIAQREQMPTIKRRAGPSPLEINATALLTALAFSSTEQWTDLILEFFKAHGLGRSVRGRPRVYLRDGADFQRGLLIDRHAKRLEAGFQLRLQARLKGGFSSDDKEIGIALKDHGYNDIEIKALLVAKSLQDAACRLYFATEGKALNVALKGIRNSHARYKCLRDAMLCRD